MAPNISPVGENFDVEEENMMVDQDIQELLDSGPSDGQL
jgi:hypothetical protein